MFKKVSTPNLKKKKKFWTKMNNFHCYCIFTCLIIIAYLSYKYLLRNTYLANYVINHTLVELKINYTDLDKCIHDCAIIYRQNNGPQNPH